LLSTVFLLISQISQCKNIRWPTRILNDYWQPLVRAPVGFDVRGEVGMYVRNRGPLVLGCHCRPLMRSYSTRVMSALHGRLPIYRHTLRGHEGRGSPDRAGNVPPLRIRG
jgi:hypothetical protein